jgi:serine/threonine-protein kinase
VTIIRAVAKGLEYAHNKNFIHRDVKPMNILFNADYVPKLVDFGIVKERGSAQAAKTMAGLALGSPPYMSPEQATGQADIDRRSDIYSLGITFYKMLTGTVPFTGEVTAVMRQHITQTPQAPREINPAISEQLNQIVLKMIAKEREARYQTAAEFIADLDQYRAASTA